MSETIRLESLLPHRPPMLLLDGIVHLGEQEIIARKRIAPDAFFLQGHYPDFPIVPGIITCECIFQAGAALLAHRLSTSDTAGRVPVVARIQSAKFREPIRPGDEVLFHVRWKEQLGSAFFLQGEARRDDRVMASVEFACALAPRPA